MAKKESKTEKPGAVGARKPKKSGFMLGTAPIVIASWDDATNGLTEMSHIWEERCRRAEEFDADIRSLQSARDTEVMPLDARYEELEAKIKAFAADNLDAFGKKKTLSFPYGSISMRKTESVEYDKSEKETVEKLRDMGLKDCFKETLKPIAAALKRLGQDVRALAGVRISESVSITVKPLGKD